MAEHYPFTLTPLPYAYNALEPYLSEPEVYAHHTQCQQNYVNLLNKTLSNYPQFQDWSLKALVVYADTFPAEIRTDIKNYAGGVFNHELYFSSMSEKEVRGRAAPCCGKSTLHTAPSAILSPC